jgi:hypothetical protein
MKHYEKLDLEGSATEALSNAKGELNIALAIALQYIIHLQDTDTGQL